MMSRELSLALLATVIVSTTSIAWCGHLASVQPDHRPAIVAPKSSDNYMSAPQYPIDQLNLSLRTRNSLVRGGVTSIQQVLIMSDSEILSIRNMGINQLIELKTTLIALGYLDSSVANALPAIYTPDIPYLTWGSASENLLNETAFVAAELNHQIITALHLLVAILRTTSVSTVLANDGIDVDTETLMNDIATNPIVDINPVGESDVDESAQAVLNLVRNRVVDFDREENLYFLVLRLLLEHSLSCSEVLGRAGVDVHRVVALLDRIN